MQARSHVLTVASVAISAVMLSACTGDVPADPTQSPSSPIVPSPEAVTPNPIEADTMLLIRATATAENGAQVSLEYQVHQPIPWDDVAGASMPEIMAEACGDVLSLDRFKNERWSFTRSNVTALSPPGASDWPADATIEIRPSPGPGFVVGRGFLVDAGGAASTCLQTKVFTATGRGGMALGLPGDALESGGFTGWAQQSYGFRITSPGVILSDCTVELFQLGRDLGGGSGSWTTDAHDTSCLAGATAGVS